MKLEQNVGTADRVARLALGAVLGGLVLVGAVASPAAYLVGGVGIALLATGATGFCPLYALLGVRTRPAGSSSNPSRPAQQA